MSASRILVVGHDRLGLALAQRARGIDDLVICTDRSSDWRRIAKLIRRRRIKLTWLAQMAWAEAQRPKSPDRHLTALRTNRELLAWAERGVNRLYLFRAGLIINRTVIETFADVLNVHCATIPDYGGVAAIPRALRDAAYNQNATLHRVTERIDDGEILKTRAYVLDPRATYRRNEDAAYEAGMKLLIDYLEAGNPE